MLIGGRREVRYSYPRAGTRKLDILHTGHFRQEELEGVVERVRNGDLRIRPLIRDVMPVEEAPRVYDTLAHEPHRLLGRCSTGGICTVNRKIKYLSLPS